MNPRTISRLAILAQAKQAQIFDELRRHEGVLSQTVQQRAVLAAYRQRLSEIWRDGAVVTAAAAQRAGHFVSASDAAGVQIEQAAVQARLQRDHALQNLAANEAHQRGLADAQRQADSALAAAAEKSRDLATTSRPKHSGPRS